MLKQIVAPKTDREDILMAMPDFESGAVKFQATYEPGCWRNQIQMMYILGEAMYIAQHYVKTVDQWGNFDFVLTPIDQMNPHAFALRKRVDAIGIPTNFISLGGVTTKKDTEGLQPFREHESGLQYAREEFFSAVRVGTYHVWKLVPNFVGWTAENPREDVYPFMNSFNAGQQIKHPAEVAAYLLDGCMVKIHGNFAESGKWKHPREHIIKGYRQAMWRDYQAGKFPTTFDPSAEPAK